MKPTPVRRILIVLACLLALWLLMSVLAQAGPAAPPSTPAASRAAGVSAPVSASASGPQASAITLRDDRGRTIRLHQPPQRIVSLLPSLAETVCVLGACDRLVGVDRYTNWPEAVRQLPQVGGGMDPSIEAVVALRPDVVLMSVASRASERLEALGVTVVALEPKTHADVQRVLGKVALVLGVRPARAQQVWQDIDRAMDESARSLPAAARGLRVYFEVSPGPYGAGASSFIGETLARLGARNIIPAELGPFPKLNPEFIVRANPDAILVGARSSGELASRPGWDALPAVRAQRLCVFSPSESDTLVRPGPRMQEGARLMAQCLRKVAAP